ncbi:MAG: SDR family oxidoreductase [Candidatus Nanopelagicales bacterium]|nr:SDR family oxidoreductase [Candidatus Nanopelagicales bacterium]
MSHAGKVAFITGGAIGFGYAFAEALGSQGASVVIAEINMEAANAAVARLQSAGIRAIALECDVADDVAVDAAVAKTIAEFGGIDILINNAGLHLTKYNLPFSTLTRAEVRALFDVNVIGIVNCSVSALESMRSRGGGSIINISSMASNMSTSPYGVSKLAVRGLTMAFAKEFADAGIRVNAISPGLMATDSAMADLPPAMIESIINDMQFIHRRGEVEDIVNMMLFLVSDKASFITGETYKVSGGAALVI